VGIGACDARARAPLAPERASPSRLHANLAYMAVDISGPAHDFGAAFDINAQGDVLGAVVDSVGSQYAIRLANGARILAPAQRSECSLVHMLSLTSNLLTAGRRTCGSISVAFRWQVGSRPVPQPGVVTPPHSDLFEMSETGVIVGQRSVGGVCCTAFRAAPGAPVMDLLGRSPGEPTGASTVNRSGLAAGVSVGTLGAGAMLWNAKGSPRYLGQLGTWTAPTSLNDRGEIAGLWISAPGEYRVFHWSEATGLRDLGQPNGEATFVYGMNNHGEIVGHTLSGRAWVKPVDGPFEILPDLPGATIGSTAWAINDCGQVVGRSGLRAVMWTDRRVCR
jgi:uncharacterized membrane protein